MQNFLQVKCLGVLQEDTLSELKQLNRSQRKAIKVNESPPCLPASLPACMFVGLLSTAYCLLDIFQLNVICCFSP